MFSKLLKYEFKSTSRVMWLLYLGLIGLALLLGIVVRIGDVFGLVEYQSSGLYMNEEAVNTIVKTLLIFLGISYFLVMNAVFVITTVMIILRFYRNILGDEGYLMHTLPVSTTSLLNSKLTISFVWMIMAVASVVLSFFVFSITSGFLGYLIREGELVRVIKDVIEGVNWGTFTLFIITSIVSLISGILMFYFSMAIGNLANKNKFLFSVLAYLAINTVFSIFTSIMMVVGGNMIFDGFYGDYDPLTFTNTMITATLIMSAVIGVVSYLGTNWILRNKLNLA